MKLYELYVEVFKLIFPTKWEDLPEKSQKNWEEFQKRVIEDWTS